MKNRRCYSLILFVLILASFSLYSCSAEDSEDVSALDLPNDGAADSNNDRNNDDSGSFNNTPANNSTPANNGGWGNNGGWDNNNIPDNSNEPDTPDNNNEPGGNTNVNLGGAQDFGYFRRVLNDGNVPRPEDMDPAGFFAEHHTPLPEPICGERICVQGMLGVLANMINGNDCTLLQLGLNSPITPNEENRPPLSLAVVVDSSGSMAGSGKMEFVQDGLRRLVNELRDEDQISLIDYDDDARVLFSMAPVSGARNELNDIIGDLHADGGTNLYGGLEKGYEEVFSHYDSGRQNRVILLSDGEASAGVVDHDAIVGMSRGYNSDGIGLTTVGLGSSFNPRLMQELAQQADGNFYFLEDSAAVEEVFTQEIGYFTVPVAFDLELSMTLGSGYRLGRAMGSSFWEDTEEGGRLSVPSVFLAHRVAHDDVEPGGGRRGGGSALILELMPTEESGSDEAAELESQVARLELSFREPGTNRIVEQSVEVVYPYAPWNVLYQGYFQNDIVEKSFVMLNIYAALEMACTFFHDDTPIEAIALLERVIAASADYEDSANGGEGDVDIQLDIELLEQLSQVIRDNAQNPDVDVDIDDDPWPRD